MPMTIKSVCDEYTGGLCKVPPQNFGAAAIIRDVQRATDPKGTKKLNTSQVKTLVAFLQILVKTAYQ